MKTTLLSFFLSFSFILSAQISPDDFVFTVNLPSSNTVYQNNIGFGSGAGVDVDWNNDGVVDTAGYLGGSYDFGTGGTHTIRVKGNMRNAYFSFDNRLTSVVQWGNSAWQSMDFSWCPNLTTFPLDTPDISLITDLSYAFEYSDNFNGEMNHWDVSSVTNMRNMFRNCLSFNRPLDNWDVSNVTNMKQMFMDASVFTQSLNSWDVSSVSNMEEMFAYKMFGTPNVSNWDVSNVTNMKGMFQGSPIGATDFSNWDVSSVTDMSEMFKGASMNKPLDNWNVANVTLMTDMFDGCLPFDQPLHHWDFGSVTSLGDFLENTPYSTSNYDSLILHWHNTILSKDLSVGSNNLQYCLADSIRSLMITNGWSFTGDSKDPNCQAVGLVENEVVNFKFYPNPANSILQFEVAPLGELLQIFDLQGRLIEENIITEPNFTKDLGDYENGIYLIRIGEEMEKLVIQN